MTAIQWTVLLMGIGMLVAYFLGAFAMKKQNEEELERLHRYRVLHNDYVRWLVDEPKTREVLLNLKGEVEGTDPYYESQISLGLKSVRNISQLRHDLRMFDFAEKS